jgi:hypothetical protein
VSLLRHSPSPQEIQNALAALRPHVDGLFFVVPRAGRALNEAALLDRRIAYAAVDDAAVYFEGEWHRTEEDRPVASPHYARASWARLAMLRLFALGAGVLLVWACHGPHEDADAAVPTCCRTSRPKEHQTGAYRARCMLVDPMGKHLLEQMKPAAPHPIRSPKIRS